MAIEIDVIALGTAPAGSGSSGPDSSNDIEWEPSSGAPIIVSDSPPDAIISVAYSYTIHATGSPTPTFAISSGALPPGISLSSSGVLSGTPTALGSYSFVVVALNGVAPNATTPSLLVVVGASGATPSFTADSPPNFSVGVSYGYTFTASGSPAPTFAVSAGSLPPGLSLASNGVLSGVPTTGGAFMFVVTATNAAGSVATSTLVISSTGGSGPPIFPTMGWFDPSSPSDVTVSGGFVSVLADKTAHGRDVGTFPVNTMTVGAIGLLQCLTGGHGSMNCVTFTQAQPITIFAVVQASGATVAALASADVLVSSGFPTPALFGAKASSKFWYGNAGTDLVSSTPVDTSPHVLCIVFNGSSSLIELDGVQIASGAAGATGFSSASISIGGGFNGGGGTDRNWLGLIGEMMYFSSALSSGDRGSTKSYLSTKWGTP